MTAETMFLGEGAFDLDGSPKTLECTPSVAEARIRNNTCVLSPETTQGTTRIFFFFFLPSLRTRAGRCRVVAKESR